MNSCLVDGSFGRCGRGTSFAAPHVTGIIALMLEQNPTMTPDEIREALLSKCDPLAGFRGDDQGAGLLRWG